MPRPRSRRVICRAKSAICCATSVWTSSRRAGTSCAHCEARRARALSRSAVPRYLAAMSRELPLTDAAVEAATLTGQLALYELRVGDVLAGRFRIEGMLGVGGMGVVYRAHDTALGIDVAIKLLRPELARKPEAFDRFRQELLLARQVSSTHVVRIHDIAEHEGRWFITMDYIDGESLERRMDRGGKLDPDVAVPIL